MTYSTLKFLPRITVTAIGLLALPLSSACSDDHFESSPDAQTTGADPEIATAPDAQAASTCDATVTVALKRFWNGNELEPAQRDHFYTTNDLSGSKLYPDLVTSTIASLYVPGISALMRKEALKRVPVLLY